MKDILLQCAPLLLGITGFLLGYAWAETIWKRRAHRYRDLAEMLMRAIMADIRRKDKKEDDPGDWWKDKE